MAWSPRMRTNREREGNFKGRREVEPSPVDPRDLQYMQWSGKARQPIDCARADVLTSDEWIQRGACRKLPCGFLFCTGLFLNRETPCVPATVKLTIAVPWLMPELALKPSRWISGLSPAGGRVQKRPALPPVAYSFYCGNNDLPNKKTKGNLLTISLTSPEFPHANVVGTTSYIKRRDDNARLGQTFLLNVLMLGSAQHGGKAMFLYLEVG